MSFLEIIGLIVLMEVLWPLIKTTSVLILLILFMPFAYILGHMLAYQRANGLIKTKT